MNKPIITLVIFLLLLSGCGQSSNTAPANDSLSAGNASALSRGTSSKTGCIIPTDISISQRQFFYSLDTVYCKDSIFEMGFKISAPAFCIISFYDQDSLVWETGTTSGNKKFQNLIIAFSNPSCTYLQRFKTYILKARTNCGVNGDQQIYSDYSQPFTFNTK